MGFPEEEFFESVRRPHVSQGARRVLVFLAGGLVSCHLDQASLRQQEGGNQECLQRGREEGGSLPVLSPSAETLQLGALNFSPASALRKGAN